MYIYNEDGTKKPVNPDTVEVMHFSSTDILKIENHKNGVNFYLRNGEIKFLSGCKTKDGISIEWD